MVAKYVPSNIECSKIRPFAHELINRCGGVTHAARYSRVHHVTLYKIMSLATKTVRKETAQKIVVALKKKRDEDRTNHSVHEDFINTKHATARMEKRAGLE